MIFRFKLDAVEVKEPINWEVLSTGYERIIDSRGAMIARLEGDLIFWDTAYDAIKTEWSTNGPCGQLDLTIEYKKHSTDTFTEIGNGYTIRIVDCEFDHDNCTVKVAEVRDNSYMTKLNANADIKAQLDVGRSKNDEDITAKVPTVYNSSFFNVTTGAFGGFTLRKSYDIYEVLEFLIAFATDDAVTFDSTFFGVGGDGNGYKIATGKAIGTGSTEDPPTLSFTEVLSELNKMFNVVVVVDDSGATPEIRIEEASTTFIETVSTTISGDNIRGLKQRFIPFSAGNAVYNGDKPISFFSVLKIGSTTTTTGSYPDIEWRAWDEEEYHVLGACAAKQTLELVGDWIRDSNVIEAILAGSTTYDNNVVIFETDNAGNANVTQYDLVVPGTGPYTYNNDLTNDSISDRFLGAIPASIAAYLGDGNDGFRATDSALTASVNGAHVLSVWDYDNETSDPNNNYNPVTYRYTAPSNGLYIFRCEFQVTVNTLPAPVTEVDCDLYIRRYDAGHATVLQFYQETLRITTTSQNTMIIENASFYLNAGEIVEVWFEATDNQGAPPHATFDMLGIEFETTQVTTGGGIYQTYDPADFRGDFWLFEVPMSYADYLTMVAYPTRFDAVFINRGGFPDDITGWLIKTQYKLGNDGGIAVLELVSTGN